MGFISSTIIMISKMNAYYVLQSALLLTLGLMHVEGSQLAYARQNVRDRKPIAHDRSKVFENGMREDDHAMRIAKWDAQIKSIQGIRDKNKSNQESHYANNEAIQQRERDYYMRKVDADRKKYGHGLIGEASNNYKRIVQNINEKTRYDGHRRLANRLLRAE